MRVLRILLKLGSALLGLYFMLGGVILTIATGVHSNHDSQGALRIISACLFALSLPFLVAVASPKHAKILSAVLLVPASIGFLFVMFSPSLQPDTRLVSASAAQVLAIAFAVLLFARIADAVRTSQSPVVT